MAFEDLRKFMDGPLLLPVGGKVYTVPQMSAKVGLEMAAEIEKPESEQVKGLISYRPMLTGPVYDQMVADGLTAEEIIRCALTVNTDYLIDREAAESFFKLGEIPKGLTQRASGKATKPRTRTGGASTTTARGTGSSTRRSGRTTR